MPEKEPIMDKLKALLLRYRGVLLYGVFGVLTTLVNMAVYALCYTLAGLPNVVSTVIAWVLAVSLAFLTNKLWVFESRSFAPSVLRREIPAFFGARIATGLLDVGIMYAAVDRMHWNAVGWKLISNLLVIVLNYVASKLLIFKKTSD